MKLLTIDFETYYDNEYSVSKMTTEEYIRDPRFQIICVSVCDVHHEYHVLDGANGVQELHDQLVAFGADKYPVLSHNAYFDAAILAWRLGIVPPLYLDTMCMANALIRHETGSASLKSVAEHWKLPAKGTAVVEMKGRRRESLSAADYAKYAEYCKRDTMIARNAFTLMEPQFPRMQMLIADRVIRMFTRPVLEVDEDACRNAAAEQEIALFGALKAADVDIDTVMSDAQFAACLSQYVTVPTKVSKRTGKKTTAFSKTDPDFQKLESHPNPKVQLLVKARKIAKSTIERTRLESFAGISSRNFGKLPVPLKYYGAITGRLAGMDKINMQNLKRGSILRKVLRAPKGHYVVAADQAQIEARINACWAGQKDLVAAFASGEDVYSDFATTLYNKPINKDDYPQERFIGKTCILGLGYGMGPQRLVDTLSSTAVTIDYPFSETCVSTYRKRYPEIKRNWYRGEEALSAMLHGASEQWGPVRIEREKLVLPSGLALHYPDLRSAGDGYSYVERVRANRVGGSGDWTNIYGAKLVENGCQAMAAFLIMEQLAKLSLVFSVVLQVHDEIVMVVEKHALEECREVTRAIMTKAPHWMPDLPLAIDFKYGDSYGDCK